jgi:hypothetical protein
VLATFNSCNVCKGSALTTSAQWHASASINEYSSTSSTTIGSQANAYPANCRAHRMGWTPHPLVSPPTPLGLFGAHRGI